MSTDRSFDLSWNENAYLHALTGKSFFLDWHSIGRSVRIDTFDGAKPRISNRGKKRRFLRQAQDTEFIEVQYQP